MPDERLFIKVIMPKQGKEQPNTGGGGKAVPFKKVTSITRRKLNEQVARVQSTLQQLPLERRIMPFRARLDHRAIAKSHLPKELFTSRECPIIGVGATGELIIEGTAQGLSSLSRRIRTGDGPKTIKAISAVTEISPFSPSDRLRGATAEEVFRKAPVDARSGKRIIKVQLFIYRDTQGQDGLQQEFDFVKTELSLTEIDAPWSPRKARHIILCDRPSQIEGLSKVISVKSIAAMPVFRVLKGQNLPYRPLPAGLPIPALPPRNYPIVAVVDSGITTLNPMLNAWIHDREPYVAAGEEDTFHGTFVAGLMVWANELNPGVAELEPMPCRLLDVHVLPNSDPSRGMTGVVTEAELLQDLDECLRKHANEVKVWNMSLGSDEVCEMDRFSDLAVELDDLQDQYAVSFVIAAGNYSRYPLLGYPRSKAQKHVGRITSPADSVLGICVGAVAHIDHATSGLKRGDPAPFSRNGPGPNHIIKPDLVHVGGVVAPNGTQITGVTSLLAPDKMTDSLGTSFSTPLVSRQLAHIYHTVTPTPSPTLARALLTHNARDFRDGGRVADGDDHYLGFGTPMNISQALECQPWMTTLVFEEDLRPGYYLEWDNFPFPASLKANGKYRAEISMTIAYPPVRNQNFGAEYCETHVEAHFGVVNTKDGEQVFNGKVPLEHNHPGELYESFQIARLRKWAPVRTYYSRMPNGVQGQHWRLFVKLLTRHSVEQSLAFNQRFVLILTIADPDRIAPVYNEMAVLLRTRYQTQNLNLRPTLRVQGNQQT